MAELASELGNRHLQPGLRVHGRGGRLPGVPRCGPVQSALCDSVRGLEDLRPRSQGGTQHNNNT
eukprot:3774184-Pyramimonas_sp.AAC.1